MLLNEYASRLAACVILAASVTLAPTITTASPGRAAASRHSAASPLCQVNNFTVEMPKQFLLLRIVGNSYIARENSAGVLTLRNGFPQAIQEFAAVVEYLDATGKDIFSMAFAATASPAHSAQWFADHLPSQYSIMQWTNAATASATFSIGATSGLTSAACPVQARATLLHIVFDNGTPLDWSAPDWQLPAQPEEIPGDLTIHAPPPASLPEEFLVRVHVPAPVGSAMQKPQIELLRGTPTPFFNELRNQMLDWRFWFALRDGKSADGDTLLLIRVHASADRADDNIFRVTPAEVPQTLGIVDLMPQSIPNQWSVFYGGAKLTGNSSAQAPP